MPGRAGEEFEPLVMTPGWRHVFESRIIPTQSSRERQILTWTGSVETWDRSNQTYHTRHGEYRGELNKLADDNYEWITPEKKTYRFYDPTHAPIMAEGRMGRLFEIEDLNGNKIQIQWNEFAGLVTQVIDSVGGKYAFHYDSQTHLTNVSYKSWAVNFGYSNNHLVAKWITTPPECTNVNTKLRFEYNNKDLLYKVYDPVHSNAAIEVAYDEFLRVIEKKVM